MTGSIRLTCVEPIVVAAVHSTRALTGPSPACPLLTMQVADFCAPSYRGGEELLILSYEAAQQHAALLKAAPPFALLVCDEAHRIKSILQPYINPGCNPM